MRDVQLSLFAPELHDDPCTVSGVYVDCGRSIVVQNCWCSETWHIVDRHGMTRTRRGCWTLVEALFYAASPLRWRALGRVAKRGDL